MTLVLPSVHPRQIIRAAVVTVLREVVTLAGPNVFPNRLEFYRLDKLTPPFIGVYSLNERVVPPVTSPPVYRRRLSLYLDCWQTPSHGDGINAELDLLAAQVEAVMMNGRNRIRSLASVSWRQAPAYESTEISLIADEASVHFASQTLEYSMEYEWVPDIDVSGLGSFKLLTNAWSLAPGMYDHPPVYSRITLQGVPA